jgi:hypothetical protein
MAHASKTSNGVQLSGGITDKLERMRHLNSVIKTQERPEDDLVAEHGALRADLARTFIPLIEQLAEAGLLTLNINIEDIDDIQRFSTLFGEPTVVFENGNIWIDGKHSGGMLRTGSRD